MGYTTEFIGKFKLNKQLTLDDNLWLQDFSAEDHRNDEDVPGYYCQWIPSDDGWAIEWDENEKFNNYIEWLEWLIERFFAPKGYILNGQVRWEGEENDDIGLLVVANNKIMVKKAKITFE